MPALDLITEPHLAYRPAGPVDSFAGVLDLESGLLLEGGQVFANACFDEHLRKVLFDEMQDD